MKKTLFAMLTMSLVTIVGTGTAAAQEFASKVIPVEMYACTYNDRKGPEDLEKFASDWNEWADSTGMDTYAAWTLTPFYTGPSQEFDFLWIGAGTSGAALGAGQEEWLTNPGGLLDDANENWSCAVHNQFASLNYKAVPSGDQPENAVLTFSDCSMKKGASFNGLGAAMRSWSQAMTDAGSPAAIFHWYPVHGGGGDEFDFKWLQAHESLSAMGAEFDRMAGGMVFQRNQLLSHLVDCDASRVYLAKTRRTAQLR